MTKKRRESKFIGHPEEITAVASLEEARKIRRRRKAEINARLETMRQEAEQEKKQEQQDDEIEDPLEGFREGWHDVMNGNNYPISTLWDAK
jgi:uncharacterized protein involved in exopolysaccharide biosynthesis